LDIRVEVHPDTIREIAPSAVPDKRSYQDFQVTLTMIRRPDDGARRRWIEQILFGRRPGDAQDDDDGPELTAVA